MRHATAGLFAIGLVALVSSEARAQSVLPSQRSVAFSAERLFGFYSYKGTASQPDFEDTQKGTQFAFLWANNHTAGNVADTNADAMPRLAVDFFVTDGLTLGAAFGYYSATGTYKHEQVGQPQAGQPSNNGDLADISTIAFAPRAGYLFRLGSHAGIWPRIGLSYISETQKMPANDRASMTMVQTNFEAMVFLAPVEHFAFVLGPVLDLPMSGKVETTTNGVVQPNIDLSWRSFGISAGITGYL